MRLLLVKTSSLGDIVHALVPLTDAVAALPGLRCDWLVEEAYAAIPAWHPAVDRVIPCALRRWRKAPLAARRSGEWAAFRESLRRERYDRVLDAQGLLKSAWLAAKARGPLAGRTFGSAREGLASLFYDRRIAVDLALDEVSQLRQLFAAALGYPLPATAPDFGVDRSRFPAPSGAPWVLFAHAAAWPSKLWPEDRWIALGRDARARGLRVLLPWGSEGERVAAQRIADGCGGEVLPRLALAELAPLLVGAQAVVGLDTGITHMALALGTRTVTLYGPSVPVLTQAARGTLINLVSTDSRDVDTRRPNTVALDAARAALAQALGQTSAA